MIFINREADIDQSSLLDGLKDFMIELCQNDEDK